MARVIVFVNVTLDGVMQAPGRPDEDRRGGFEHGGWAVPYAAMNEAGDARAFTGALLLGRRTWEDFASFWPSQKDSPFSSLLDGLQKYVASRTLEEPLAWQNSTLLAGDAAESVARLKEGAGSDLIVMGSGELIRSLLRAGLVDELVLLIHPLLLGSGRRLFDEGTPSSELRLVGSKVTSKGVVVATYEPSES